MNKKGDFTGLLYLIVMIAAAAFILLVGGYASTKIATELGKNMNNSASPEVMESFQATTNAANNTLTAVWFIIFGGLLLGLFITAWNIPTKPIYVPIFIILLIITIIIGVAMSNAYETLYGQSAFSSIANTQGAINFVMGNLPYVALIIGLIVLIITFAKPREEASPYM